MKALRNRLLLLSMIALISAGAWGLATAQVDLGPTDEAAEEQPADKKAGGGEERGVAKQLPGRLGAESDPESQLEAMLESEKLFYRKQPLEDSDKNLFIVMWDQNGEVSKLTLSLKSVGHLKGETVFVVYGWTSVAEIPEDATMPTDAIIAAAAANDRVSTGNFSVVGNNVYANTGAVLVDLTSEALWFYLAELHSNRVLFRRELQPIFAANGINL